MAESTFDLARDVVTTLRQFPEEGPSGLLDPSPLDEGHDLFERILELRKRDIAKFQRFLRDPFARLINRSKLLATASSDDKLAVESVHKAACEMADVIAAVYKRGRGVKKAAADSAMMEEYEAIRKARKDGATIKVLARKYDHAHRWTRDILKSPPPGDCESENT